MELPHVRRIVMRYTSLASLANSGNRDSFTRSKDWPYHLDSTQLRLHRQSLVLIGKYEFVGNCRGCGAQKRRH